MFSPISLDNKPPFLIPLISFAVFAMSVAIHALVGFAYAALFAEADIIFAAGVGVIIGLMFTAFVLFELIIGKFFVSKNRRTQVLLMLGQSLAWVAIMGIFFSYFDW